TSVVPASPHSCPLPSRLFRCRRSSRAASRQVRSVDALDDAYSGLDSVLVNGWDIGVVWRAKIRRMNTRRQQRERRQPERQPEQLTPLDDLGLPKWVTAALSANRVPVPDDAPARPKRQ